MWDVKSNNYYILSTDWDLFFMFRTSINHDDEYFWILNDGAVIHVIGVQILILKLAV